MSFPVCSVCAKNLYLCVDCQRKYDSGQLTSYDVDVSRQLFNLMGDSIGFKKAIDADGILIIVCDSSEVGKIIGLSGENIKKISNFFNMKVKIIGGGDFEEVTKSLIAPAHVKSINSVFSNGQQGYRVHIAQNDMDLLRISSKNLKMLIQTVTDSEVELIFD